MSRVSADDKRLTAYLQPQHGCAYLIADLATRPPITAGFGVGYIGSDGELRVSGLAQAILDRLAAQTPADGRFHVGTVRRGKRIVHGIRNVVASARPGDTALFLFPDDSACASALRCLDLRRPATEGGD